MTGERMIPLLPCASIDDVADFYRTLGFDVPHWQTRPNPYAGVRYEDIELHFFGIRDFDPTSSLGTCVVHVPDPTALYEAFRQAIRSVHGTLLVAGIPRMTRLRRRENTGHLLAFNIVDPGGNTIRFFQDPQSAPEQRNAAREYPSHPLTQRLDTAIVLGESKVDPAQAAKILDSALRQHSGDASTEDHVEALVYRAELALALDDPRGAGDFLTRARGIILDDADRERLSDTLAHAAELDRILVHMGSQDR